MNNYASEISELNTLGIGHEHKIWRNLSVDSLVNDIVTNKEGKIASNGAAMVDTGEFTGRSPKDKYIVDEPSSSNNIWWGDVNQKLSEDIFDELYKNVVDYYNESSSKTYLFDGFAGADPDHSIKVRFLVKKAWQAHFVHNMFIRPENNQQLENFTPDFTIINASGIKNVDYKEHGMNSENFVIFHIGKKIAIIGGTEYGGEMKLSLIHI